MYLILPIVESLLHNLTTNFDTQIYRISSTGEDSFQSHLCPCLCNGSRHRGLLVVAKWRLCHQEEAAAMTTLNYWSSEVRSLVNLE